MSEIHINPESLAHIINSYEEENDKFVLRSFSNSGSPRTCSCYINKKDCKILFYIKKDSIKIQPVGKNVTESKLLVDYIISKGYLTSEKTIQFTFPCNKDIIDSLVYYIENECQGIVSCNKEREKDNMYKFVGYNRDYLTFTFYPTKNKAMIQGRPFEAYGIVTSYLARFDFYSFEEIVDLNNEFAGMNTPIVVIRDEMRQKLGAAYSYMDEALRKCISGSIALLKQTTHCENYTGCIAGEFIALEGYLLTILSKKYEYKIEKYQKFSMFHRKPGEKSKIDNDARISKDSKKWLYKLYNVYSSKRNVYLHSNVEASQTRVISTLKDAKDLSEDILKVIKDSYLVIFK